MSQCIAACVSVEFCQAGKTEVLHNKPHAEKKIKKRKEKALVDSLFKDKSGFSNK